MLYKKILIFLFLSKASCTLSYWSEEQKYNRGNNSKTKSETKVVISWNGINYLLVNNIYYLSHYKYNFFGIGNNVYFKKFKWSLEDPPSHIEPMSTFMPRIVELFYNLFSFSLYLFKKPFFYKIDILGDDVFFYHMTSDYTTNILSFFVGLTAYKISFSENLNFEGNLGIGISWRRLSYSYITSYRCAICNPHREIKINTNSDYINNALSFEYQKHHDRPFLHYTDIMCKESHPFNHSIPEHLKDPYTWKHFDIIINCSLFNLLLFNIVSMSLNFNFGIREIFQAYKYSGLHNKKHKENQFLVGEKINLPSFMLRSLFSIRHFSLRILFFIPKRWLKK